MNLAPLKTPPQDPANTILMEWDDQELEAWLTGLRRADVTTFSDTIHGMLLVLNRTRLKRLDRYAAIERLRPVANDACAMLVASYRSSPLPLTEREQVDADRVQQIYAELATGYKIAVNDEIASYLHADGNSSRLQLAIQRALLCLGQALLACYRVYAPEPPLLWRDVHTLYRNSEQARLQSLPLYGAPDSDETALSIRQAYLRIAVLALTNPYHLMQGEADELYRRIGRWVHFVQLRPANQHRLDGAFTIDLEADLPARYVPVGAPTSSKGDLRILDLEQFSNAVAGQIRSATALLNTRAGETLSTRMQRDMYARFQQALSGRRERGNERKPTLARLVVARGLSDCHFLLNDRQAFAPESDQKGPAASAETAALTLLDDKAPAIPLNAPDETSRTSRFVGFDTDADDVWRRARLATPPPSEPRERSQQVTMQWNRKNESEGGLALFCAKDASMQVRVGELVAYAQTEAAVAADWQIGAVRWLRTRPNGGLEFGIERFAADGHAVAVQAISGAGKGSEYLRGILIPRINPVAATATLLAPASLYDVGSVLRLQMRHLAIHIRLTELVDATQAFAHFRFKLVKNIG